MNLDLSSSGYLLPMLIAGGVLAVYLFMRPKGEETVEAAGLLSLLKGGKLAQLLPLAMAAFQNKAAIAGLVSAFVANLAKLFVHPDEKAKEAEKPK